LFSLYANAVRRRILLGGAKLTRTPVGLLQHGLDLPGNAVWQNPRDRR
jgi:hypothetical protein